MDAVVFQPKTYAQVHLLQEIAKAMRIPVSLQSDGKSKGKTAFLQEIRTAGEQAKQIVSGKAKGQTLESLFDELD